MRVLQFNICNQLSWSSYQVTYCMELMTMILPVKYVHSCGSYAKIHLVLLFPILSSHLLVS